MNSNTTEETNYRLIQQGTTAIETWLAIFPCLILVSITSLLASAAISSKLRLFVEFLLLALPCILCFTIWASKLILVNLLLIATSIVLYAFMYNVVLSDKSNVKQNVLIARKPYITNVRSITSWLTIVAILAVDFSNVFPNRFMKTTMYGFSLMDVGVGLFVFTNGIVTPEISGKESLLKVVKSVTPLIAIGGARFLLLTQLNYYYSTFEYGVHWNFFITLAFVRLFTSLIIKAFDIKHSVFLGIFLLLLHETILQLGVGHFVLSTYPRHNFFLANREGIVSLTGYVGLYFLSVAFGHFIRTNEETFNLKQILRLFGCSISVGWACIIADKNFGVCRRLANSGYCFWILFIGITATTYYYTIELLLRALYRRNKCLNQIYTPLILDAINYNPLVFFLLGNFLTGFVNLTMKPSEFGAFSCCIILLIYLFINCIILLVLFSMKLRIKL